MSDLTNHACIMKTPQNPLNNGAERLRAGEHLEAPGGGAPGVPRPSPTCALHIISTGHFLSCILYNQPVNISVSEFCDPF